MKVLLRHFLFFFLCVWVKPDFLAIQWQGLIWSQVPHHSEKKSKSIWNILCVCRWWQGHSRINYIGSITWQVTFIIQVQPHLYGLFPPGYHCLGCCWLDKRQSSFKGLFWSLVRSGSREERWTCMWGWTMVGWGSSPGPVTVRAGCCFASLELHWFEMSWSLWWS